MDIDKIADFECEIKQKVEDKAWDLEIDLISLGQSMTDKLEDPKFQAYLERVDEDIEGDYYDEDLNLTITYVTYFKRNKIIIIDICEGNHVWDEEDNE